MPHGTASPVGDGADDLRRAAPSAALDVGSVGGSLGAVGSVVVGGRARRSVGRRLVVAVGAAAPGRASPAGDERAPRRRTQPTRSRNSSSSCVDALGLLHLDEVGAAQLDVRRRRRSAPRRCACRGRRPARRTCAATKERRAPCDVAERDPGVLGGAQGEVEVPVDRGGQELVDRARRRARVGHREHEAGVGQHARCARGPTGSRLAIGVSARPACLQRPGEVDRERAGPRRAAGAAGRASWRTCRPGRRRREQAGHPLGVADARARTSVLTPIDQPISTARSTPKWSITDSASSTNSSIADPARVGRAVGAAGAAVVPGHDPHAAVGVEQRRPGPRAGAEPVAEHDGRAVDRAVGVVGPGPQPGAVVGEDVVVPDLEGCRHLGGAGRALGGHGPDLAAPSHHADAARLGHPPFTPASSAETPSVPLGPQTSGSAAPPPAAVPLLASRHPRDGFADGPLRRFLHCRARRLRT